MAEISLQVLTKALSGHSTEGHKELVFHVLQRDFHILDGWFSEQYREKKKDLNSGIPSEATQVRHLQERAHVSIMSAQRVHCLIEQYRITSALISEHNKLRIMSVIMKHFDKLQGRSAACYLKSPSRGRKRQKELEEEEEDRRGHQHQHQQTNNSGLNKCYRSKENPFYGKKSHVFFTVHSTDGKTTLESCTMEEWLFLLVELLVDRSSGHLNFSRWEDDRWTCTLPTPFIWLLYYFRYRCNVPLPDQFPVNLHSDSMNSNITHCLLMVGNPLLFTNKYKQQTAASRPMPPPRSDVTKGHYNNMDVPLFNSGLLTNSVDTSQSLEQCVQVPDELQYLSEESFSEVPMTPRRNDEQDQPDCGPLFLQVGIHGDVDTSVDTDSDNSSQLLETLPEDLREHIILSPNSEGPHNHQINGIVNHNDNDNDNDEKWLSVLKRSYSMTRKVEGFNSSKWSFLILGWKRSALLKRAFVDSHCGSTMNSYGVGTVVYCRLMEFLHQCLPDSEWSAYQLLSGEYCASGVYLFALNYLQYGTSEQEEKVLWAQRHPQLLPNADYDSWRQWCTYLRKELQLLAKGEVCASQLLYNIGNTLLRRSLESTRPPITGTGVLHLSMPKYKDVTNECRFSSVCNVQSVVPFLLHYGARLKLSIYDLCRTFALADQLPSNPQEELEIIQRLQCDFIVLTLDRARGDDRYGPMSIEKSLQYFWADIRTQCNSMFTRDESKKSLQHRILVDRDFTHVMVDRKLWRTVSLTYLPYLIHNSNDPDRFAFMYPVIMQKYMFGDHSTLMSVYFNLEELLTKRFRSDFQHESKAEIHRIRSLHRVLAGYSDHKNMLSDLYHSFCPECFPCGNMPTSSTNTVSTTAQKKKKKRKTERNIAKALPNNEQRRKCGERKSENLLLSMRAFWNANDRYRIIRRDRVQWLYDLVFRDNRALYEHHKTSGKYVRYLFKKLLHHKYFNVAGVPYLLMDKTWCRPPDQVHLCTHDLLYELCFSPLMQPHDSVRLFLSIQLKPTVNIWHYVPLHIQDSTTKNVKRKRIHKEIEIERLHKLIEEREAETSRYWHERAEGITTLLDQERVIAQRDKDERGDDTLLNRYEQKKKDEAQWEEGRRQYLKTRNLIWRTDPFECAEVPRQYDALVLASAQKRGRDIRGLLMLTVFVRECEVLCRVPVFQRQEQLSDSDSWSHVDTADRTGFSALYWQNNYPDTDPETVQRSFPRPMTEWFFNMVQAHRDPTMQSSTERAYDTVFRYRDTVDIPSIPVSASPMENADADADADAEQLIEDRECGLYEKMLAECEEQPEDQDLTECSAFRNYLNHCLAHPGFDSTVSDDEPVRPGNVRYQETKWQKYPLCVGDVLPLWPQSTFQHNYGTVARVRNNLRCFTEMQWISDDLVHTVLLNPASTAIV